MRPNRSGIATFVVWSVWLVKSSVDVDRGTRMKKMLRLKRSTVSAETRSEGRFPQLADSDELWRLLVTFTARKAMRLLRAQARRKRGGRSATEGTRDRIGIPLSVEELVGNEPTPEFAAQVAEEYEFLLGLLNRDQRAIAIAKLEGFTNEQIAASQNRSLRTVERKLKLIRAIWEEAELR